MPNAPAGVVQDEERLLRMADVVFVTAQALLETRRKLHSNVHLVPNAADYEHFARSVPPAPELVRLPSPIIGYVGALAPWVDYELLRFLAESRPSWSFVFVGPILSDVSPLRGLANVHLLGYRAYPSLPSYLAGFDVCIIPFRMNDLIEATNPVKFYEYLAAGKPVVATPLPEILPFSGVVRVADSPESFLEAVEESITGDSESRASERRAVARHHTWRARVEQISAILEEALERKRAQL